MEAKLFWNKLNKDFKIKEKINDEFNIEELIYENIQNKDLIIKKTIANNEFSNDLIELINKRINFLNNNQLKNKLSHIYLTVYENNQYYNFYEESIYNFDNFLDIKLRIDNIFLDKVLFKLIDIGCNLENNFEFHPNLIPKNVKIDKKNMERIFLVNPYSFKDYYNYLKKYLIPVILNLEGVVDLKQFLTIKNYREQIIFEMDNENWNILNNYYQKNLKKNIFDWAILLVCIGTKTKYDLIFDQKIQNFNNNFIIKLKEFYNKYSDTKVCKIVEFIWSNVNNLPTFFDLRELFETKNKYNNENIENCLKNIKENILNNKNDNELKWRDLLNNKKEIYPINNKKETYYNTVNNKVEEKNIKEESKNKNIIGNILNKINKKILHGKKNEKINSLLLEEFNKPCDYSYNPVFYKIPGCTCKEPYNVQAYFPPQPVLFYTNKGIINPSIKNEIYNDTLELDKKVLDNTEDYKEEENILRKTLNKINSNLGQKNKINNLLKNKFGNILKTVKDSKIQEQEQALKSNNSVFKINNQSKLSKNLLKSKENAMEKLMNDKNDNSFMKQIIKNKITKN